MSRIRAVVREADRGEYLCETCTHMRNQIGNLVRCMTVASDQNGIPYDRLRITALKHDCPYFDAVKYVSVEKY